MKGTLVEKINRLRTHSQPEKPSELIVAPKDYQGLPDKSDDYELDAKILERQQSNPALKRRIDESIDCEDKQTYGPRTNNRGYGRGYNGDD